MSSEMGNPLRRTTLWAGAVSAFFCLSTAFAAGPASADEAKSIALLTVGLQNDHAEFEPTHDAERARMANIGAILKDSLGKSGKYKVLTVSPDVQAKIEKEQKLGECGGCELRYGNDLGADQVAWIYVQKVSDLILNINVYIKDVKDDKTAFVKSVDIRGNTDESWNHSMNYLIKHYLLPEEQKTAGDR